MNDFCYWKTEFTSPFTCARKKILLVKDDHDELVGEYDLSLMGLDKEVNSLEDFIKQFPQPFYQRKENEK